MQGFRCTNYWTGPLDRTAVQISTEVFASHMPCTSGGSGLGLGLGLAYISGGLQLPSNRTESRKVLGLAPA